MDEIYARLSDAESLGPWMALTYSGRSEVCDDEGNQIAYLHGEERKPVTEFIANAPSDIRYLRAYLQFAEERAERLREVLVRIGQHVRLVPGDEGSHASKGVPTREAEIARAALAADDEARGTR